jgi:ABC-type multidrug transport system fused ATPase/permease subunit
MVDSIVTNILKRPLSFFDTTPSGQLMNRYVKDVGEIDFRLPFMLSYFLSAFFTFLGTLILLGIISPLHFILIIVVLVLNILTIKDFIKVNTELERMDKLATSPVLSGVGELVNGVTSIRAYDKLEFMKEKLI